MRKVFISYARQNKPDIEQLVEHLRVLGCDTWHDSSLHGGQDWWEEILRRIAECDTFIAIISRDALNSTACRREFDWAESLDKPVLPVAVEPPPKALPRRFVKRQIVDYSDPNARDRAALTLAGGLATLPAAPPLPDPLPEQPAAPLSYLTDLIDLVTEGKALDHDQQRHILSQLEPALYSVDPEERRGGHDILEMLSSRDDLYADVYRTINRLKEMRDPPGSVPSSQQRATEPSSATVTAEQSASTQDTILSEDVSSPDKTKQRREEEPEHTHIDGRAANFPEVSDHSSASTATTPQRSVGIDTDLTSTPLAPGDESITEQPITSQGRQEAEAKSVQHQTPRVSEDSGEAVAATSLSTDKPSPVGTSGVPKSGSATGGEDRRASLVPPTDAESTTEAVPFFRRLNRRTKLVFGGISLVFVVAVAMAVVAIIPGDRSPSGPGVASRTSTAPPTSTTEVTSFSTTTSATPSTDPATQRLLALVPAGDNCRPSARPTATPGGDEIATVGCASGSSGVPYFQYMLYPDQATLDKAFDSYAQQPDWVGACPGGGRSQTWSEGRVTCWSAAVFWSVNAKLVIGHVWGSDVDQLYGWWTARYQ